MQVEQGGPVYTMIHPDELRRRLAAGESFAILDARSEEEVERSGRTLPGAVRIPADQLESRRSEIPKGKTLLLVAEPEEAESLALEFLRQGWTDVYLIEGGFEAYRRSGAPTAVVP